MSILRLRGDLSLQEGLGKWRELNSAAEFLSAAAAVNNLSQTLPLLLHHKVCDLGHMAMGKEFAS